MSSVLWPAARQDKVLLATITRSNRLMTAIILARVERDFTVVYFIARVGRYGGQRETNAHWRNTRKFS